MWQFYADESAQGGLYTIAGYLSSSEKWSKFSEQWDLLARRYGKVHSSGKYYLHMREQAKDPHLTEFINAFARLVEEYVIYGLAVVIRESDLVRIFNYLLVKDFYGKEVNLKGKILHNATEFANFVLQEYVARFAWEGQIDGVNSGEKIQIIFDERSGCNKVIEDTEYSLENSYFSDRLGPIPLFKNDVDNPPLQAADMVAYWLLQHMLNANRGLTQGIVFDQNVIFPWRTEKFIKFNVIACNDAFIIEILAKDIVSQRLDLTVELDGEVVLKSKIAEAYRLGGKDAVDALLVDTDRVVEVILDESSGKVLAITPRGKTPENNAL